MNYKHIKLVTISAVVMATMSLTACTAGGTNTQPTSTATTPQATSKTIPADINNYIVSGDYGSAPEIEIKQLGNIDTLLKSDVKTGEGAEIKPTDTVTVQYT